jgi:predicted GNAT family N-acyltransferase
MATMTIPSDDRLIVSRPVLGMNNEVFVDALKVRTIVFVEEQKVPAENELDSDESRCWHWCCYHEDPDGMRTPIGAVRLVTPPHPSHAEGPDGNYLKVGRMATVKEFRGRGVGRLLVDTAVKFATKNREQVGCKDIDGKPTGSDWDGRILAHAQKAARGWWEKVGFVVDESMGEWTEEGIVHVGMWRKGLE